jgi:hypothetical protein
MNDEKLKEVAERLIQAFQTWNERAEILGAKEDKQILQNALMPFLQQFERDVRVEEFEKLLPFDDVHEILGRICIHCARIAQILRLDGKHIAQRAEDEQAATIYYLLGLYVKHGNDWAAKAEEELRCIRDRLTALQKGGATRA